MSNPIDSVITSNEDVKAFLEKFRDYNVAFTEQSIKIRPTTLSCNRAAVALAPKDITLEQTLSILKDLGFKEEVLNLVTLKYDGATTIGFGIEKDTFVNYRVYIETFPSFDEQHEKFMVGFNEMGWAYKYSPAGGWSITTYSFNTTIGDEVQKKAVEDSGFSFYPEMCKAKDQHFEGYTFIARDTNTKRDGFYIQVNGLSVDDISNDVKAFAPSSLEKALEPLKDSKINIVAGGTNGDHPYLTLYFRYYE